MTYRKPRNIDEVLSGRLTSRTIEAGIDVPPGVTIYVTASHCGRYRKSIKTVTVPTWAYNATDAKTNGDPEYALYYVAHELAHAWVDYKRARDDSPHGRKFYQHFKRLCPPHLWHYETEYKPRDARRAGISTDRATNIANARPNADDDAPVLQRAAGPGLNDAAAIRANAIAKDPRIESKLTNVRDDELKSYVRGWFQL